MRFLKEVALYKQEFTRLALNPADLDQDLLDKAEALSDAFFLTMFEIQMVRSLLKPDSERKSALDSYWLRYTRAHTTEQAEAKIYPLLLSEVKRVRGVL